MPTRRGVLIPRPRLLAALLIVSTVTFVIGVALERSTDDRHDEPPAAVEINEIGESGAKHVAESGEAGERAESAQSHAGETRESFLGIDYEATPFVALAVALSLALAAGVWLRPGWGLWLATVAVAMLAFGALDVREVAHQLDESSGGLAALAAGIAVLHLTAATIAALMARSSTAAPRDALA
jgi:Flp pilus assembly protein TadB